ncbi:Major Facilitator Superfamily protein [Pseudovibrio axinellae]|uniref:Major Facilitator Superfamily protein n=1 Tax=Pseudovibrio axinellae TaxID=989403 RepID=A0A165WNV0_9HYPH|nr:MFS transporter [Pseudovibrio axinellae]KZL16742.1 Major Facilitator Superfamily protein [Pseudovibrio axinellae]SEQ76481.1 Predicted arabinose efflux permease, MFS family [Pseudovibrio axinellae]
MGNSVAAPFVDDGLAKRNALLLAFTQSFAGGVPPIIFATTSILASTLLVEDKSLATLPVTAFVLGTAIGTMPAGMLMRAFGRRAGLAGALIFGMLCALLASYAAYIGSFSLLCLSTLGSGFVMAFTQQARFAAADTASPAFKPKAISWVLTGGILAGVVGPQTVILTQGMFEPFLFVGTYLAQAVLLAIGLVFVVFLKIPLPAKLEKHERGRPLLEILKQKKFFVAVTTGMIGYAIMNLIMTSAPLAMVACGLSTDDAALGIQWHVIAMFAPSFITGSLIGRFGHGPVIGAGFVLYAICALVGLTGLERWIFWSSLVLLGLGWNFSFVGASALLTQTYRAEEQNRIQAVNDFFVFGLVAAASFSSGKLLNVFGWETVNMMVFPFVIICLFLVMSLMFTERREVKV